MSLGVFCHATAEWNDVLAQGLLDEYARHLRAGGNAEKYPMENAAKALVWAGRRADLDALFRAQGVTSERLIKRMDRVRQDRPKLQSC